jgi:ribonucleoside-diphosphate reductase alpha chain
MSFNFLKDSESLRNACCEVTSSDDSDKCNLGTLWLNRHASKEDLAKTVWAANALLLCGGLYSDVPYAKVREVGSANNRIGLGLGGIAEWLLLRRLPYQVNPELHKWLNVYEQESEASAYVLAKQLGVAVPRGKRAIAPTGTIGILAETTTGIEPLFCKAYKRRAYLEAGGEQATTEYVVDGTIKRMLASGMSVAEIKEVAYDAYDISFKDRVKFQADVQNYVDMAISSTCNMPPWGSELNSESTVVDHAKVLYKYARRLRGFTCYPDGSRSGQPLVRCDLEEALANEGKLVYEQREDDCSTGVCGL